jgi:hypothetical protein
MDKAWASTGTSVSGNERQWKGKRQAAIQRLSHKVTWKAGQWH